MQLGIPVVVLSFLLLRKLYRSGAIDPDTDPEALTERVKALHKAQGKQSYLDRHSLQGKWMQFGGGFYGTAALWTLVVIEIEDLMRFLGNFPGFAELTKNGIIDLLVQAFVNQIQNFVAAIIWFTYWADGKYIADLFLVAYAAFNLGNMLAKRLVAPFSF